MGNLNFDASEVAPMTDSYEPLPQGWYQMRVISADMHVGQKVESGEMLKLQLEVSAEAHMKYAGRRVFNYLCINHQKDTPRNIARRHLSSICQALGKQQLEDTEELLGAVLNVRLKVRPPSNGYEASNEVAGYGAADSDADCQDPPPATPAKSDHLPSGAAKRAWK
jgi:hypothetical protein